ncbi:polyunsaturated fatty acid lipoxygenase ALOX15B-like [Aplochiton taeniatus]
MPGDLVPDEWFCRKVEDTVPELLIQRAGELDLRRTAFRWSVYTAAPCLPHIVDADSAYGLPAEVRFSFSKETEFAYTIAAALVSLGITNTVQQPWASFDAIGALFTKRKTEMYKYVEKHWREDEFFGYQFLNGHNPMMICACSALPDHFPVSDKMVQASIQPGSSLTQEIKKGNIFLMDYHRLDGVAAAVVNKKQQYLASPLVLLYKTPEDKLLPIAIQLKQKPGDLNPIFLPSDSQYDWLLAKTFVRSAEFAEHELKYHLLHTHLLCEVFAMATLRHFPMVHPLYKLLIQHFRYTQQINIMARKTLMADYFPQNTAVGGPDMVVYLAKAMASLTYSTLCLPEEITARGMDKIPNYYYRDDGLNLWAIINRYVQGVVTFYYTSDAYVTRDSELQNWILDIFTHGFHANSGSGIPRSFRNVPELVKFITMVVFTASAQHAAVNNGQVVLGAEAPDQYEEAMPRDQAKRFHDDLKALKEDIHLRNSLLPVPYTHLDPEHIENSVAI